MVVAAVIVAALLVAGGAAFSVYRFNEQVAEDTAGNTAHQEAFDQGVEQRAEERSAAEKAAVTIAIDRPIHRPLRILFVGDSLTAGYYATTPDQSFVAETAAAIGDVKVLEGQQQANGEGKTGHIERVDGGADVAVIELGTDDVVDQDLEKFRRDYNRLLDMIEDTSPGVKLLCLGVWHQFPDGYDDVIEELCLKRGGVYEGLNDLVQQPDNIGPPGRKVYRGVSDDFHPNDRGHDEISKEILYHLEVR